MFDDTDLKKAQSLNKLIKTDPDVFIEKAFGDKLEKYQAHTIRKIMRHDRVAIKACHNMGKTFILSRVIPLYLLANPYSKVITTAPTFNQVKNILWSELRSLHAKSKTPLGGTMLQTEWQLSPNGDWFALGFTSRQEQSSSEGQGKQSSFQGFHAKGGIMVVFDEATGIPPAIWTMAEGLLTQSNVKFVAIGNPTSKNSEFFKCFKSPEWAKISLSCFDSPNLNINNLFTINDLKRELQILKELPQVLAQERLQNYRTSEGKGHLLSMSWVMGRALKWGIDHPLFLSKCIGEFPVEGDGSLITLNDCEMAQIRDYKPKVSDRKILGVDVARFGTDSTVMTALHGYKYLGKKVLVKRDTVQVVGEIFNQISQYNGFDVIVIDETGLGAGVVDLLKERKREGLINPKTEIRGVQFGSGVSCEIKNCTHISGECDKARFANVKAKMYSLLSDEIKNNLELPKLDKGEIYLEELPTIKYHYDSKGRMIIESKDEYKKRTGRDSPDHADSLALANFGRYDQTNVGAFTNIFETMGATHAGGLSSGGLW